MICENSVEVVLSVIVYQHRLVFPKEGQLVVTQPLESDFRYPFIHAIASSRFSSTVLPGENAALMLGGS